MKSGDRVVCIKDSCDNTGKFHITKGQIYTILGIWECSCCVYFDIGFETYHNFECVHCLDEVHDGIVYVPSHYFRPIEYNSATEELANKEIVIEKLDIPIKEPKKEEV